VLERDVVHASILRRLIQVAAVVACLGVAASGCFWRTRDVRDDRHDHDDHRDDHHDEHRDDHH
jgi:hypothetical protein